MFTQMPWQPDLQLFFEATTLPGVSGVMQCALGNRLTLRGHGSAQQLEAADAAVLWLGVYGAPLFERGRQPYNQTSPAAYMPLPQSSFEVVPLPSGVLLIQRQASRNRLNQPVHDGGGGHYEAQVCKSVEEARRAVERFLQSMGLDEQMASTHAGQVLSRLWESYAASVSPSATL